MHNLLFSAIQHHNDSLLDDLLEGDDGKQCIDQPNGDGQMLLHFAVLENDLRCVECLLKHGANPNVFDVIKARTPLHLAVELGHAEIVKTFLELEHVNLNLRDDRNLTCHEIAQFCDNQALADLVETRHNEIEKLKNDFYTVMNQACGTNDPKIVREILQKHERQIIESLPRGWSPKRDGKLFARSSLKELINWSSSIWNDVTLLFKSASRGHTEICKLLIEYGATAKCNENTNYSPLYVAAYGGYTKTVKLLLDSFPYLIKEATIEKWTVLHACCLQGHSETAKLILNYNYPQDLKERFISKSGLYEYHFAFDLNAQDAAGQTVIYLAVSANDEKLLDTLLQFKIEAKLLSAPAQNKDINPFGQSSDNRTARSHMPRHARIIPDRPKLNKTNDNSLATSEPIVNLRSDSQLHKILKQLKLSNMQSDAKNITSNDDNEQSSKYLICPFEMDTYCDYNSKTALHLAVCQQYHNLATTLLVNGSNPNLPILSRDSIKSDSPTSNSDLGLNWLRSSKSTCLKEACRLNDDTMCEILIRYGASDNQDNLALQVAAKNKDNRLISKFLSLKSNADPEFKINKKCNVEFASRFKQSQKLSKTAHGSMTTTFSSMFPSTPVMIDWQNLRCIKQIDTQWLIDASLRHNKRLKHPTNGLMAITRLDLSSNNLKTVHPVIFRLPSLRELDLSSNRLETLIIINSKGASNEGDTAQVNTYKLIESHKTAMKRSKSSNLSSIQLESSNIIDINEYQDWDLPYLETLDLHDNLLISLPDCLFELPRLSELDVSSNQIRQLPWAMWTAPSLREMIASGNLLDDLPKVPPQQKQTVSPVSRLTAHNPDSPTNGRNSSTPNQSFEMIESSFLSSIESDSNKDHSSLDTNSDVPTMKLENSIIPINNLNYWRNKVDIVSDANLVDKSSIDDATSESHDGPAHCKLTYLNLSHNSFESIPPVLACMATELTRLNLSYNRISSVGDIGLYPVKLKSLDLSNNQIYSWFVSSGQDTDLKHCYADCNRRNLNVKFSPGINHAFCIHKTHQRLDNLKSINLSYNSLSDIRFSAPQELNVSSNKQSRLSLSSKASHDTSMRESLYYPNITALDISYNKIHQVPRDIAELKDLSVLNLSGNVYISSLPAELGLASKLWNLGINGCNLNEPLKSIVESKTYKTMDIIGYLRSILEEAKPYARMKLMLVGLQGIGKTTLLEQMRQEGSSGSRRRAPEHWTKRMGHTSRGNLRNQRGVTLSTVGVDIHDWIYHKRTAKNQPNFGPVSFSTWDFGGQEEFYSTHRYFLSRRSMYLVVWRLTDGLNGIMGIQQWLVNIQSRAPSSPVIIVGTHEDMIDGGERGELVQLLQAEVHKRFIDVSDHDKCGLPRVMDSLVVSTKSKLNIKNLCNRIYDVVFSLRCPGSSERLLEQRIPATYLYLEEIVSWIAHERQQHKREPVLTYDEYRRITSEQLKVRYNKEFRDLEPLNSREINYNSELHQATRFLHENGVLLHYEDANLRDLYFLDPQWLCDILSHVVTIREINPHVKNGLMKIDDLGFLFKSINVNLSGGIQSYVVNLLNKFEVALTWNSQFLLIPSLLPSDPRAISEQQDFRIKMAPRTRGRSVARRLESNKSAMRSTSIGPTKANATQTALTNDEKLRIDAESKPEKDIYRLVLLRYLPAGFLARLQSGILSDPEYDDICTDVVSHVINESSDDAKLIERIGSRAGWTCWKGGISLALQQESTINCKPNGDLPVVPLMCIQELSTMSKESPIVQSKYKVQCAQVGQAEAGDQGEKQETNTSKWCNFDLTQYSNVIVISIKSWRLRVIDDKGSVDFIEPSTQNLAQLLATTVDHIDNLLEDWYPSLGARFAHTLGGNYLVTRIVPCISCSALLSKQQAPPHQRSSRMDQRGSRATGAGGKVNFTIVPSQEAITSLGKPAMSANSEEVDLQSIYCYYVEHCIYQAYNISTDLPDITGSRKFSINRITTSRDPKAISLKCPNHGSIALNTIAPDILFDDICEGLRIDNDQIDRCKLVGRGTFGFVFKGTLRAEYPFNQLGQTDQDVALKLLQPVDPGPEADSNDLVAYKSAKSNWTREPFHSACKSYCTARHEVNILQSLRHANIVVFIGLCVKPLAIVLELAPLGCLNDIFKSYKRAGMHIDQYSVQKTLVQVARALEFLHQRRVIYRDLKAENVLVWSFPSPFATNLKDSSVELKLADYGISRQASSTGIWKGFAGTINFLAPEILRHNGDEEYTEKVDCFSFGMFMYELLTLRPPFKHNEGARSHLADGGRPTLSPRDLIYPSYMIDLMSICWSQEPHMRPTASQIVSISSTPEFMQLLDVAVIESRDEMKFKGSIQYMDNNQNEVDLWFGQQSCLASVMSASQGHWLDYQQLSPEASNATLSPTCLCVVDHKIWLYDIQNSIHMLPLGSRSTGRLDELQVPANKTLIQNNETLNKLETSQLTFKYQPFDASVKKMDYVKSTNIVLMLTESGGLWICDVESMECQQLDDASIPFSCFAIFDSMTPHMAKTKLPERQTPEEQTQPKQTIHVYCGQSNGISCLEIADNELNRQSILPLAGRKSVDMTGERLVETGQSTDVNHIAASATTLWTAAGCTIHQWSLEDKCVIRKLECWKLVPCSESLESINIEQYYEEARTSRVSSMVHLKDQLYVGTSHGCFMVIEASTLKPIIVFRPYESDVTLLSPTIIDCDHASDYEDLSSRYLVTIGTGYRDLMKRYVSSLSNDYGDKGNNTSIRTSITDVAILWSASCYNL